MVTLVEIERPVSIGQRRFALKPESLSASELEPSFLYRSVHYNIISSVHYVYRSVHYECKLPFVVYTTI